MRQSILKSDVPSLLDRLEFTFFDHAPTLENASRHKLRGHFKQWRAKASPKESPRAKLGHGVQETARYESFLQIVEEALNGINQINVDDLPVTRRAHIKLIRADWQPVGKDGEAEENEEPYDEIDGIREDDVGWVKVHPSWIGYSAYLEMSGDLNVWPTMYRRPPDVVLWS